MSQPAWMILASSGRGIIYADSTRRTGPGDGCDANTDFSVKMIQSSLCAGRRRVPTEAPKA